MNKRSLKNDGKVMRKEVTLQEKICESHIVNPKCERMTNAEKLMLTSYANILCQCRAYRYYWPVLA